MIKKIHNKLVNKKIESILRKYGIQVRHALPGRIRLGFPEWKTNEDKVLLLMSEMALDPDITSIEFTKETGTALILYKHEAINQSDSITRWLSIIEKYS